ncbi:MAG: metal-dependent hydrolase [Nanoarchaeota archaeon]
MLLRTHLVFSIFIYALLFNFLEKKFLFFLFLIFAVCIVDIDSKNSKAGKSVLFRPIQFFTKHRGAFHTLLFCLIFSAIFYFADKNAGLGFFVGYMSHLILDCFTKSGIKLFWPISNLKFGLGVKSGGLIEEICFVLLFLVDIGLFVKLMI